MVINLDQFSEPLSVNPYRTLKRNLMCVYIYTYIYVCIHIHIHIHIHIQYIYIYVYMYVAHTFRVYLASFLCIQYKMPS